MGQGARAGPFAGSTSPRTPLCSTYGSLPSTASSFSDPAMNLGASVLFLAICRVDSAWISRLEDHSNPELPHRTVAGFQCIRRDLRYGQRNLHRPL